MDHQPTGVTERPDAAEPPKGQSSSPPVFPDPSLVMRLALAYRSSMVLFAASELDLFTAIAGGRKTLSALTEHCQAAPAPLRLLLEACVAEGLLTAADDRFENTPAAEAFLVRGRPGYIAHGLKFAEHLYPTWGRLADLVRSGRPVIEPESILGDDKEKTRAFVLAMHERARGMSAVLPHGVSFAGRRHLLDVGGGPGTYSIALVRETPGLMATVLDLPGVLEVTREIVDQHECSDRVRLLPGDYLSSPFGRGYDAVLLSGMMHRETPDSCRRLLQKSFDALEPGGLVVVSDVFFDTHRKNTPPFALYFALNMMLTSREGSAHAKTEMVEWARDAGFQDVTLRDLPPPNPHTLVLGTRP
jgi:predicted O-methyltransferase YrrM